MPKPSPELRRARLAASAVKGLTVKPGAGGRLLWYWEPNRAEKAAGWKPLKFGPDKALALAAADSRNAEVAAWRRGEPLEEQGGCAANQPASIAPAALPARHSAFMTIADHARRYRDQYLVHLSPGHQRTARYNLVRACDIFGDMLPGDIREGHVARWMDSLRGRGEYTAQGRQVSDVTAHNYKRTFAALRAWIANPHEKFGQPKGRMQIWELDDRAAFRAAAFDLGWPGMAFALRLAYYSSQRTQNQITFTEAQLTPILHRIDPRDRELLAAKDDGQVWGWEFVQPKTGTLMHIAFEPEMLEETRRIIAHNRARDRAADPPRLLTHVLVNDRTGLPWKYRDFNRVWNLVKDHAIACTGRTDMDALHWHDLKRTRVVDLKRQGFSHDRIGLLTGNAPDTIDEIMKVYGPIDPIMTTAFVADAERSRRLGQG